MIHKQICAFASRLEEAATLWLYAWMTLYWPVVSPLFLFWMLLHRSLWPLGVLYLAWYLWDFRTPSRGSRPLEWVQRWRMWRVVADYFPIEMVKTAELPPQRNYVIAAHPHGILGTGSALSFGTFGTGFRTLFPGLDIRAVTLPLNFVAPFRRECLMALGAISSSEESIGYVLERSPSGGCAIGIVPGGVAEMAESRPGGRHRVVLANRKGFVRLAIEHGADLVPVYNFGEQELFVPIPVPEGGLPHRFQMSMKRMKGSFFPLAYGCSLISLIVPKHLLHRLPPLLRYGIIPFRKQIVSVVGAPLRVEKNATPSRAEVDAIHAQYCARLKALFDEHKCTAGGLPQRAQLEFI